MPEDQRRVLGTLLCSHGISLVTAESCTAGMVAALLGDVEGCGEWLDGALVTYSEKAKQMILGIAPNDMEKYGLTSEEIAQQMASGALAVSRAQLALSNTGVAGPDDAPDGTKAGTVCFAWLYRSTQGEWKNTATVQFKGDRTAVRRQAADYSIAKAVQFLGSLPR